MNAPPAWTPRELERERLLAIENFRKARIEEPLEDYLDLFDDYQGAVEELLETTVDLTKWTSSSLEIFSKPNLREVLRYVAAPPISDDDLRVLAEAKSFSKSQLKAKPDDVKRLLEVIVSIIDRRRFVWLSDNREATEGEKGAAVMASAALLAASRAQTNRRSLTKKLQEEQVMKALDSLDMKVVKRRTVKTFSDAPNKGEYCGESKVGTRKADLVIRLWDERLMALECKVSNSALNSVKRLNNDAAVKAVSWKRDFGERHVVPAAVLSGVYDLVNLEDAQERGLHLFWAHDLKPLKDFLRSTKE